MTNWVGETVPTMVMAAALVRAMATLLFGVSQHDPGTFSVVR